MAVQRKPSVRLLVAACVLLPVLAVTVALVLLTAYTSNRIAEQLGATIVSDASQSVDARVRQVLDQAVAVGELYARRIERGILPTHGLTVWEPYMLDDLLTRPYVASICFGNIDGDATWLLWNKDKLEVGRSLRGVDGQAVEYNIERDGTMHASPIREYVYDPRQRPWWDIALAAPRGTWTPVYFWFGNEGEDSTTGTGYTRAIHDENNQLRGVIIIDVTLGGLGQFLRELPVTRHGYVFIVDDHDLIIAASDGPANGPNNMRLPLSQSSSIAGVAAIEALSASAAATTNGPPAMVNVKIGQDAARGHVTVLEPYPGIRWRVVVVLPEAVFLGDSYKLQRRTLLVAMLMGAVALLTGLVLARRLAQPLLALTDHVRRVGQGDFDSRINLRVTREMVELSSALNRMTLDLRQRMQMQQSLSVAMEVQQSLLPAQNPVKPGLDATGRSKYCDETGGDYYDFIDVPALSESATLIVVGDVMGHGIAAALLMATARAVVRAHSDHAHEVGSLLTRVNDVLSDDARHQRFMTLALVIVDPVNRCIRWASAGHDPAIVYLPDQDTFEELIGGDIPLGVMENVSYKQYQRDDLPPGAIVFVGTDGIWETSDAGKQLFGKDRLRAIIRDGRDQPTAVIAQRIEAQLSLFRGKSSTEDDVTFVIARMV